MSVQQTLFSRILGEAPHKVFALHCTMAHSGAWRGLSEALSGEAAFHAFDMFNHGKSPDWDGQGEFQLRMADAVFDQIDAPVDLLGHSFGATVALRMATMRPEKVRRLVLIDSVHLAVVRLDQPEAYARSRAAAAPFSDALALGNFEDAARIFNRGWGDHRGPKWNDLPEARRQAMTRGVQIVPACGPSISDDLPGLFDPGGLDPVQMPVLLLRGEETDETVRIVHEGLARRLPQAESHAIPGAGHMVPITHPRETADALRSFFSRKADAVA